MKHDALRFYWTVASGSTRKALRLAERDDTVEDHGREIDLADVPEPESVMVSFTTKMNEPWPGPDWFIDSGGFSTLDANSEYEASVDDYIQYLAHHEQRDGVTIERFALRDWACENKLLRENGRTERLHQNWTVRDHVECLELADEYGVDAEPVAVIQGFDVRDYLHHLDYYRDHGLLTDHLGIGSVCKRKNIEEMRSTLDQLRDAIPSRITLHGFGLSTDMLHVPDIVENLDSVDTAAWDSDTYYDAVSNASTDGHRYTWDRVQDDYVAYRDRVQSILDETVTDDRPVRTVALGAFTPNDVDTQATHVLLQCRCGTLVDPESPATHPAGCRQCARSRETFAMALQGLCCDPDIGEHHYLCPADADEAATCLGLVRTDPVDLTPPGERATDGKNAPDPGEQGTIHGGGRA